MTKKTFFSNIFLTLIFISLFSTTVFAVEGTSATTTRNAAPKKETMTQNRVEDLKARAVKEITKRIDSLNSIIAKLASIKCISLSDKTNLTAQIQTEIQTLQVLQTKIQGETDLATLRADVQSITKAYRIYWIFIPKIHVLAANDRIVEVTANMNDVIAKLQTRITAGGSPTSNLQTTLDDAKAKNSDAQTQGQNAINLVTPLLSDNGDKNLQQTNTATLKQAEADIKTANSDLKTVYGDFQKIVRQLKSLKTTTP